MSSCLTALPTRVCTECVPLHTGKNWSLSLRPTLASLLPFWAFSQVDLEQVELFLESSQRQWGGHRGGAGPRTPKVTGLLSPSQVRA